MTRGQSDYWREAVFRDRRLPEKTRVLLLYLSFRLKSDMSFSVPRVTIARALAIGERRVTTRMTSAKDLGYITPLEPGRKGRTAVYRAQYPPASQGASNEPAMSGPDGGPAIGPQDAFSGPDGGPASSYGDSDRTWQDQRSATERRSA